MTKKATKSATKKAAPKKVAPNVGTMRDIVNLLNAQNDMIAKVNARTMAMDARIMDRLDDLQTMLNKVESAMADIRSGASFMQELEQEVRIGDAPIGLQPGDYCEASKDVADELTAMGWKWADHDRCRYRVIRISDLETGELINMNAGDTTLLDRDTFLTRARVTAEEQGLAPVKEPQPWKPQVGEWVASKTGYFSGASKVVRLRYVNDRSSPPCAEMENGKCDYWRDLRPATTEEVQAHRAAEEAKKVPKFGDRVECGGMVYTVASHCEDTDGDWLLMQESADHGWIHSFAKRSEFTIIHSTSSRVDGLPLHDHAE